MKTGINFKLEVNLGGLFIAATVIGVAITFATFRRPPKPKPPRKPVQPQPSDQPPAGETVEATSEPEPDPETVVVERHRRFRTETPEYHARRDAAFAEFQRTRLPEIQAKLRESIRTRLEQPFFDMANALAGMSVALPQTPEPEPESSARRPIFSTPAAGQGVANV